MEIKCHQCFPTRVHLVFELLLFFFKKNSLPEISYFFQDIIWNSEQNICQQRSDEILWFLVISIKGESSLATEDRGQLKRRLVGPTGEDTGGGEQQRESYISAAKNMKML